MFLVGKAMIGGTNIVSVIINVVTIVFQFENKSIWLKILVDQINLINYGQLYFYYYCSHRLMVFVCHLLFFSKGLAILLQ
jgi:hypothetical protein